MDFRLTVRFAADSEAQAWAIGEKVAELMEHHGYDPDVVSAPKRRRVSWEEIDQPSEAPV